MVSIQMVMPEIGIVGDPTQDSRCGRASEREILQGDIPQDVHAQLVWQLLHHCPIGIHAQYFGEVEEITLFGYFEE
jgi:hypothetical protein